MGSIFRRGRKLWMKYKDAEGQWVNKSTGLDVGQEKAAERLLELAEAAVTAGVKPAEDGTTVATYAKRWIAERKARGLSSVKDDDGRLKRHVLPSLGRLELGEVKPRHVRDLVRKLRREAKIAPRTIISVYGAMHRMFADAVVDELILANPCQLKRGDLPKKVDKDPDWRGQAVFSRDELESIISSDAIPEDRRVLYAICFLTGARFGEAAALRWRHLDDSAKPLRRLSIVASYNTHLGREKSVKTEEPRQVPVHRTLASVLAQWRMHGWPRYFGQRPGAEDLIIPSRQGRNRNVNHALRKFHQDLDKLGLRRRRQHDMRRTLVSLANADGARMDVFKWITHGRPEGIMSMYNEPPWELLCEQLATVNVHLRDTNVVALPVAANASAPGFGTFLGTVGDCSKKPKHSEGIVAGWTGLEFAETNTCHDSPSGVSVGGAGISGASAAGSRPAETSQDPPNCTNCTKAMEALADVLAAVESGDADLAPALLQRAQALVASWRGSVGDE